MAKTGGTELNGELAMHYEHVCGHKGYSFDAFEANERMKKLAKNKTSVALEMNTGDIIAREVKGYNRGRVPVEEMIERGFDDCSYISHETTWKFWETIYSRWQLELHVPCRDPLQHLMSMCNYLHKSFDCSATDATSLTAQINGCMIELNRFDYALTKVDVSRMNMKCFDSMPPQRYADYMGTILQHKREEGQYLHRSSNSPRNKDNECIWKQPQAFKDKVLGIMNEKHDYFKYCDECMGSSNELNLEI